MKEFELLHNANCEFAIEASLVNYWINNNISFKSDGFSVEKKDLIEFDVLKLEKLFGEVITDLKSEKSIPYRLEILSKERNYFYVLIYKEISTMRVHIVAENNIFDDLEKFIKEQFTLYKKGLTAKWIYQDNYGLSIKSISIDLNNDIYSELYPFLQERNTTLDEYYDAFKNSSAKILLLMGERGTGKTSFLRGLLKLHQWDAMISYDEKILTDDKTLMRFLDSTSDCFIIEDADTFIYKREQGNNIIHKFLNLGDGLITKSDKKLILTTNITSTDEIDSALIRPGRCFDVLQFDKLTPEQAKTLIETKELNIPLPDKDVTIAELFNQQPIFSGNTLKKRVGFI